MINLLFEPQLKQEDSLWVVLLWVCDFFDQDYSFRELLAEITIVLQRAGDATLNLPPELPGDDFVEGDLQWRGITYDIYYERALGYVQFSTVSESSARALMDALAADLVWP